MADTALGFRLAAQEYDPAIPVQSIQEHPANPNEGDTDLIAESLDEFGFVGGIIVQKSRGYILAGNHRYRESVAKGAPSLPGFWLDVDDETADRWLVTDNDTARAGRWQEARLLALLEPMHKLPPGYTTARVEDLRRLILPPAGAGDAAPLEEVQVLPLRDIHPYWRNPRNITEAAIDQAAASIREFGWQQPIVTDTAMVIIVGHVRYKAALKLGLRDAPVVVTRRLSAAQAKAYRVADNRVSDYATWEYGALAEELASLGEFAAVLNLADWAGVIADFEAAQDDDLKIGGDDLPSSLGVGFALTVVFDTQEAADKAAPELMGMPGVIVVRHARR